MFYDKTKEPRTTKCDTLISKKFKKGNVAAYLNLLSKQTILKTTVI